jgi:hypothetical protein
MSATCVVAGHRVPLQMGVISVASIWLSCSFETVLSPAPIRRDLSMNRTAISGDQGEAAPVARLLEWCVGKKCR